MSHDGSRFSCPCLDHRRVNSNKLENDEKQFLRLTSPYTLRLDFHFELRAGLQAFSFPELQAPKSWQTMENF